MAARWRLSILLLVLFTGMVSPATHAQDDVDNVRAVVEQWLKQELNKPALILVEYTYSATSWPDSSLGCPAAGQTYTPGTVNGYRWTFLFDNMVRYEVHSSLDGTPAVLCTSVNVAPDVRLVVYNSPTFTILTPESWLVFQDPNASAVLFAPQAQDNCGDPGMLVTVLGRVANDTTPDQILTNYVAAVGVEEANTARTTMGSFGRSTTYQTPCSEGGTRQWRVSAFMQFGSAYRVDQWAPLDRFDQWDTLFQQMLSQFSPPGAAPTPTGSEETTPAGTAVSETGGSAPAAEAGPMPDRPPLPMAHLFVGDLFVATLNDMPGRSATVVPTIERRYLAFSPNGLYISFVEVGTGQLRVMDAEGLSPRKLAEGVDPAFPPTWGPDSQQIAYAVNSGQTTAEGAVLIDVYAVPAAGGEAVRLSAFPFSGDCPATVSDPADRPYLRETGPGNVLVWLTGDRFLYSLRCDGGLGVLSLADQQIIPLGDDFHGGVLAPDYSRFLARTDSGLALLDFAAWERTNLTVGAHARQLAWGTDGHTVYYSVETLADSRTLDDPVAQPRGEELFGMWPVTAAVYNLALVRLDLSTDQETVIWQGQGRAIGRIAPAPDGSGILFSLIPSSVPLAEVFQSGGDSLAVHETQPEPALYWLPTDAPAAYLLAYSGQPAFAPIAAPAPPQ